VNQQSNIPDGFVLEEFEREFTYSKEKLHSVWKRLQLRETFTQGQLFPYRVEFAAKSQTGEFSPGELNIHHGPFLSVHGAIGDISANYRSLDYFYGSYVISFRLVRPVQLEFFRDGEKLRLKLKAFVRPWLKPFWYLLNQILWMGFRISMS
jgi:hypothetical protein